MNQRQSIEPHPCRNNLAKRSLQIGLISCIVYSRNVYRYRRGQLVMGFPCLGLFGQILGIISRKRTFLHSQLLAQIKYKIPPAFPMNCRKNSQKTEEKICWRSWIMAFHSAASTTKTSNFNYFFIQMRKQFFTVLSDKANMLLCPMASPTLGFIN